jgi:hypothetical protein
LPRQSVQRFAVAILVAVCTFAVEAQTASTHCLESEVVLSETQTAARLERCGDDVSDPLLWHLDRVDQVVPRLDGRYDRRGGGSGSVVYVMDTGVMAGHAEFAAANSA